jgi:hypothetical protein
MDKQYGIRCYWECFGEHIGNFGGAFLRTQWEHVENMTEQTPQNKNKNKNKNKNSSPHSLAKR